MIKVMKHVMLIVALIWAVGVNGQVQIGDLIWSENVNVGEIVEHNNNVYPNQLPNDTVEKYAYLNEDLNVDEYGGLYTIYEAMKSNNWIEGNQGICPDGWRVPTKDDWSNLIKSYSDISHSGDSLVDGLFNAKLGGFAMKGGGFYGLGTGFYLSSTRYDPSTIYTYHIPASGKVRMRQGYKTNAYSLRCVQPKPVKERYITELPVTIDRELSISLPDTVTIVDSRDNHVYDAVRLGSSYWMQSNLTYYTNNMFQSYTDNGMFYSIMEIRNNICPNGWNIPTRLDYLDLAQQVPPSYVDLDTKGDRVIREFIIDTLDIKILGFQTIQKQVNFAEVTHSGTGKSYGYGSFWIDTYDIGKVYNMQLDIGWSSNLNGFSLVANNLSATEVFPKFYNVRCVKQLEDIVINYLYLSQGWNYIEFQELSVLSVDSIFGDYSNNISIIKELETYPFGVYWPYFELDMIGNIVPNTMYGIKTNDAIMIDLSQYR